MARIALTAAAGIWAVAVVALVGCGGGSQSGQSPQASSHDQTDTVKALDNDEKRTQTYVPCRGTFTAYEKDHPWFEDGNFGHDNGEATLASFVLTVPVTHADRTVDILFKYAVASTISPPDKADIGRDFTFEIPEDFLAGKYKGIDNATVRHLRRIEPYSR